MERVQMLLCNTQRGFNTGMVTHIRFAFPEGNTSACRAAKEWSYSYRWDLVGVFIELCLELCHPNFVVILGMPFRIIRMKMRTKRGPQRHALL